MSAVHDRPKLTAASLHPQAAGKWLSIIQYVCPGVFDEAISRIGTHVDCPLHGGKDDFRFTTKAKKFGNTADTGVAFCTCGPFADGFALLHRAKGGRFIDILIEVDEYLNGSSANRKPPQSTFIPPVKVKSESDQAATAAEELARSKKLWASGKKFDPGTWPYLLHRGIDPRVLEDVQDLRVVPKLGFYEKGKNGLEKKGDFPAQVIQMRNPEGELVALHRTWLDSTRKQKAPVKKAKKLTSAPSVVGCAMRLFDAAGSDVLGLTEGPETALACRQLSWGGHWAELGKIPVWAAFAERNIRNFIIPPFLLKTLKRLVIFADSDAGGTGLAAAVALKNRLAEEYPYLIVDIKVPDVDGWDWLDVLNSL